MRAAMLTTALILGGCASTLGPSDYADIAGDQATIEKCKEVGRACKADGGTDCYGAYDRCMKDGGLH